MLVIRHKTGALAGKEQRIEAKSDRVTFGRDPTVCDVVFPPDATIVARRHFALVRKPSGAWTFDLFGDPYVAVDGAPPEFGQALHSGATVELGQAGGPSFDVLVEGEGLGDELAATAPQQKIVSPRAAASRARTFATVGAVLAILAIIAAGILYYTGLQAEKRFSSSLQALAESQQRLAAGSIAKEHLQRLNDATYLVIMADSAGRTFAGGTAFVIGPNLLGTNAHVAEERDDALAKGGKLYVRASGPNGKMHEVVWHKVHPAYNPLKKFLKEDVLVLENVYSSTAYLRGLGSLLSSGNGYDVGLLRVADDANLSPVLELAPPDEYLNLAAGDPAANSGYPTEKIMGSEIQSQGPTPEIHTGVVSSVTDLFNMPADPSDRRLVHHNLAGTGGNSGSAIIGANGRVIALDNSRNMLAYGEGGRMPNAANIGYAQRVDYLLDLMSGRADATVDVEIAYWKKQTASFKRAFDIIMPRILAAAKPRDGATPVLVSENKFTLTEKDRIKLKDANGKDFTARGKIQPVTLTAGTPRLFVAYSQGAANLLLLLRVDNNVVAQNTGGVWYPSFSYTAANDAKAELVILGADADIAFTLFEYGWDVPPA